MRWHASERSGTYTEPGQTYTVTYGAVVQSVVSNSLWSPGLQQARLPYLPQFAQIHVHWVRDAIQPSHPLLPPSPFLNLSQHQDLFQWAGSLHQAAKVLELQLQHQSFQWIFRIDFLKDWLVWSLCYSRDSQESSPASQFKSINSLALSLGEVQLPNPYMTTGKAIALTRWIFASKVMSLLFNALMSFAIVFLLRSKCLLISWLQSPSAVILKPKKKESATVSMFSPSICHEVMGPDTILVFWMLSFMPVFSLSSFTFIKRVFRSSSLSAIRVVWFAYLKLIFLPAILIPACATASPSFRMMYSAYKLKKKQVTK